MNAQPHERDLYTVLGVPRGASAAEASAVTVREGEEVSVIDIILRPPLPSGAPVVPGVPGWRIR